MLIRDAMLPLELHELWDELRMDVLFISDESPIMGECLALEGGGVRVPGGVNGTFGGRWGQEKEKLFEKINYLTRKPGTPTGCQIVQDQEVFCSLSYKYSHLKQAVSI